MANWMTILPYRGRLYSYPFGDWGIGQLADLEGHEKLAIRTGAGFAASTVERSGQTEFTRVRVVDSGETLASILPVTTDEYSVQIYSVDASLKYRGGLPPPNTIFGRLETLKGLPSTTCSTTASGFKPGSCHSTPAPATRPLVLRRRRFWNAWRHQRKLGGDRRGIRLVFPGSKCQADNRPQLPQRCGH